MKNGIGYFGFESIVIATLAILVVATLTIFAHVSLSPMVVV